VVALSSAGTVIVVSGVLRPGFETPG
jgi:hypothetical protein